VAQSLILFSLSALAAAIGFGLTKYARRIRAYADVARPATIGSAHGLAQITGLARSVDGAPTSNPITGSPCVWYGVFYECDGELDRQDGDNRSSYPILLDDGTGACEVSIDSVGSFAQREVIGRDAAGTRVLRTIAAGARLHAIGRVTKLPRPERGATHRLTHDAEMRMAVSHRSLDQIAQYIPTMHKIAQWSFVAAAVLSMVALGLALSS